MQSAGYSEGEASGQAHAAQLPEGLSVVGQAIRTVPPDLVVLTVGAQTSGTNAAQVLRDNASVMMRVVEALMGKGIDQADIQTTGTGLSPQPGLHAMPGQTPSFAGYQAVSTLNVWLRTPNRAGEILDAVIGAGANVGVGVSFRLRDEAAARRTLLEAAARDARANAEVLAGALGRQLGRVIAVRDDAGFPSWVAGASGSLAGSAGVVQANPGAGAPAPGELTLAARVQITFELR